MRHTPFLVLGFIFQLPDLSSLISQLLFHYVHSGAGARRVLMGDQFCCLHILSSFGLNVVSACPHPEHRGAGAQDAVDDC